MADDPGLDMVYLSVAGPVPDVLSRIRFGPRVYTLLALNPEVTDLDWNAEMLVRDGYIWPFGG